MTSTLIPAPATTLRERMIEDMKLHRLCRTTQRNYLRDVSRFAIWLGRPPDTATDEDLRRYQIEQTETGFGAPAMNTAVSALRFFYTRTLDRPDLTRKLHRVKHSRALPTVLSREEVSRMLNATTSIKHQAILSVAYGAGLRASEVTHLKISDIDSERMLLRVECGKGGRHRNAMLAQDLLVLLREWWKIGRKQGVMHPDGWLFIAFDDTGVTFRYKDYRRDGMERQQVMTLTTDEFIRRFLIHVLPRGFHRVRHYGLLSSSARKDGLALARKLLGVTAPIAEPEPDEPPDNRPLCPCCGGHMTIIETFTRWCQPRAPPSPEPPARENAP